MELRPAGTAAAMMGGIYVFRFDVASSALGGRVSRNGDHDLRAVPSPAKYCQLRSQFPGTHPHAPQANPLDGEGTSKPTPSSATFKPTPSAPYASSIATAAHRPCRIALVVASWATRSSPSLVGPDNGTAVPQDTNVTAVCDVRVRRSAYSARTLIRQWSSRSAGARPAAERAPLPSKCELPSPPCR